MYTDWEKAFRQFMPADEYMPNNNTSKNLNSIVFFIMLGFIAAFGLITKVESKSKPYPVNNYSLKLQEIQNQVKNIEKDNAVTESEILILNHTLTQTLEKKEKQKIAKLSKLLASQGKTSSGIVIQLFDSNKSLKSGENPNYGIIHNTDLLDLVNSLWSAKAEAISINGQRITSLTEINCVGPTILINKTRIVPPFTVTAIGNPEKLAEITSNGSLKALYRNGIKYFLEKYARIKIPADATLISAGDS